jgi:DNA mismatch repair protein MutS2
VQAVEEQVKELAEVVEIPAERRLPSTHGLLVDRPIRLGDKVRLRSLNTEGVVSALGEEEAEVQVGMLRVRARLADLVLAGLSGESVQEASQPPATRRRRSAEPTGKTTISLPESPGIELDLRGQRADEALDALDRYLDAAFLAGLPFVRIIHGKGTGRLRQSVREALAHNSHVKSYEAGGDKEGGDGVTVAKLQTS